MPSIQVIFVCDRGDQYVCVSPDGFLLVMNLLKDTLLPHIEVDLPFPSEVVQFVSRLDDLTVSEYSGSVQQFNSMKHYLSVLAFDA